MPTLRLGVFAAVAYAGVIALGTVIAFRFGTPPADVPDVLARLLPVQLVAVALCIFLVIRMGGWRRSGFGHLDWPGLVWFLPAWGVMAAMLWSVFLSDEVPEWGQMRLSVWLLLLGTPFLIAFGEEVMFRGLLLRAALRELPVLSALLLSAISFAALHFVNGIAGQAALGTVQQVGFALVVGFALAPLAIRLRSLWPPIIWHWLWNVAVFASQIAEVIHPFVLIGMSFQAVISIWLWAQLIRGEQRP